MYYQHLADSELGFDPFIAPDDFNEKDPNQYGGDHPVNIYEIFKREYTLNSHARYIYYYSPGDYPLTLTPTATEYYRYGYTTGGTEVIVDVPLNGSAKTIWGATGNTSGLDESTGVTKRWVVVCRPSTEKFDVFTTNISSYIIWVYASTYINTVGMHCNQTSNYTALTNLKYIHYANINSLTQLNGGYTYWSINAKLTGILTIPETVNVIPYASLYSLGSVSKVYLPNTKSITNNSPGYVQGINTGVNTISLGACINLEDEITRNKYTNLAALSVSPQNTTYASFNNCDIIYNKALTAIIWIAPKTVRGLHIPDELPQAQITALGTKLSANIMQGYQLYLGTQITDLTNLYLSNKSFRTIEISSDTTTNSLDNAGTGNVNDYFTVENNILYNKTKTQLIKAGTSNTGDLIIPNTVTEILANSFLRCNGYTGDLIIPNNVTSIVANSFTGLSGLTGSLTIPSSVTSIASGAFNGLNQLTTLTLPVGYDCAMYNYFNFANFSAASLNTAILNLANGTIGTPKYFIISKTSMDALNLAYPNGSGGSTVVDNAALRYINVRRNIIQDSSLKLWLDASNTLSYPGSGTTWYDLSGNGNNGTMVNGVVPLSNAMQFDGVDDRVTVSTTKFIYQNLPFTISCLVRVNSFGNGYQTLFSLVSDGNGYWVAISNQANYLGLYFGAASIFGRFKTNTPSSTFLNNWVYVTVVYNGNGATEATNFKAYINGVDTAFNAGGAMLNNNNGNLIGWRSDNSSTTRFNGQINDTAIYNRALTSDEINQNFNATRSKYGI